MLRLSRLRELREEHGLTQKQLGDYLQTTPQYYHKYEKAIYPLPIERLYQLADFYQVSADYILGRTDDPTLPRDAKPYVAEEKKDN